MKKKKMNLFKRANALMFGGKQNAPVWEEDSDDDAGANNLSDDLHDSHAYCAVAADEVDLSSEDEDDEESCSSSGTTPRRQRKCPTPDSASGSNESASLESSSVSSSSGDSSSSNLISAIAMEFMKLHEHSGKNLRGTWFFLFSIENVLGKFSSVV